jgi:cell division control protein 24
MSVSTASHGPPLSRMHTAPTITTRTTSMNPYPGGVGHVPRSSQSGSVAPISASASASASSASLSSMSSSQTLVPPRNGGPVVATNNIINQRADASRSLYQICVNLGQRLRQVPGFEQHLSDSEDEEEGEDMDMDPMSSLWRCLRKGYPLMTIYNSLQPTEPLQIAEGIAPKNIPKNAAFKFVQACLLNLEFEECFVLTDLFGDDTTGFVKVSLSFVFCW